jgi:phosphohistidine phosphatase
MHQLLLLRHAKAVAEGPGLPDPARPLTARGRRDALAMGRALHALGLQPDLVLASSARRIQETLECLEPWPEAPLIETIDRLYLASAPEILRLVNEVAETVRSVMVIGHNPGLRACAVLLAAPGSGPERARRVLAEGLPTGTLVEFGCGGAWAHLAAGQARLARVLLPRDLGDEGT